MKDILNHPDRRSYDFTDLSNLRGVMGGALCPPDLLRECNEVFDLDLLVAYGCTENSPATFYVDREATVDQKTQTVGCALAHTEAKVVDSSGNTVERGEVGEILIKGYTVFDGYWEDKEKTDEVMENGWYKTGDLGVLREDGYLTINGRSKDLIIRGGENIYPAEVENALAEYPEIMDAHIVGVPGKRMGEGIVHFYLETNPFS